MPTHEELCTLVFVLMFLVLALAILVLMFEHRLFKHISECKKEREKNEREKNEFAIINKTREVVFDDLCNYFNSVKGDNNEIQR